ncbi:unnamed protein product [Linum trigynum]|uniref:Ubiquitin-like domain-containing protein n=1 Tax=Linum trigynum TaxID=586398 RepID=A0AAV2CQ71_9ROSI
MAQLKQTILHDFGISPERLTLRLLLLPYPTTMEHQTLAAYGVTAGQTTWPITVDVTKINVMVNFLNLDNMWYFVVACYEFDTVAEFRRLVVDNLRSTGVEEIGPEDMELYCGGVRCGDGGARLSQYGVRLYGIGFGWTSRPRRRFESSD